jgi:predicted ATP-binding protein involved in virulence
MKFFSTLKIKTLTISNFKGLKRFKIDELPDFVVLTDQCRVGKSSILQTISYLIEKVIYPDRQHNNCTSLISHCHDLVNSDSNACEISAKFEMEQLEMDYLQGKRQLRYFKLNKEGEILEDRCSTALRTLLNYGIRSIIERFDYIGSGDEKDFGKIQKDRAGKRLSDK